MKAFLGMDNLLGLVIFFVALIGSISGYVYMRQSNAYATTSAYLNITDDASLQKFVYLVDTVNGTDGYGILSNSTYHYSGISENWTYNYDIGGSGRVLVADGKLYEVWWKG